MLPPLSVDGVVFQGVVGVDFGVGGVGSCAGAGAGVGAGVGGGACGRFFCR